MPARKLATLILLAAGNALAAADELPDSLTGQAGDPARGRAIVVDRRVGMCLLCHGGPFPEERDQGNLGPNLAAAGSRWSAGQLRLRLVDPLRLDPNSIMPAYLRRDGLWRVAPAFRDQPLLSPAQIEDMVAFLATLK